MGVFELERNSGLSLGRSESSSSAMLENTGGCVLVLRSIVMCGANGGDEYADIAANLGGNEFFILKSVLVKHGRTFMLGSNDLRHIALMPGDFISIRSEGGGAIDFLVSYSRIQCDQTSSSDSSSKWSFANEYAPACDFTEGSCGLVRIGEVGRGLFGYSRNEFGSLVPGSHGYKIDGGEWYEGMGEGGSVTGTFPSAMDVDPPGDVNMVCANCEPSYSDKLYIAISMPVSKVTEETSGCPTSSSSSAAEYYSFGHEESWVKSRNSCEGWCEDGYAVTCKKEGQEANIVKSPSLDYPWGTGQYSLSPGVAGNNLTNYLVESSWFCTSVEASSSSWVPEACNEQVGISSVEFELVAVVTKCEKITFNQKLGEVMTTHGEHSQVRNCGEDAKNYVDALNDWVSAVSLICDSEQQAEMFNSEGKTRLSPWPPGVEEAEKSSEPNEFPESEKRYRLPGRFVPGDPPKKTTCPLDNPVAIKTDSGFFCCPEGSATVEDGVCVDAGGTPLGGQVELQYDPSGDEILFEYDTEGDQACYFDRSGIDLTIVLRQKVAVRGYDPVPSDEFYDPYRGDDPFTLNWYRYRLITIREGKFYHDMAWASVTTPEGGDLDFLQSRFSQNPESLDMLAWEGFSYSETSSSSSVTPLSQPEVFNLPEKLYKDVVGQIRVVWPNFGSSVGGAAIQSFGFVSSSRTHNMSYEFGPPNNSTQFRVEFPMDDNSRQFSNDGTTQEWSSFIRKVELSDEIWTPEVNSDYPEDLVPGERDLLWSLYEIDLLAMKSSGIRMDTVSIEVKCGVAIVPENGSYLASRVEVGGDPAFEEDDDCEMLYPTLELSVPEWSLPCGFKGPWGSGSFGYSVHRKINERYVFGGELPFPARIAVEGENASATLDHPLLNGSDLKDYSSSVVPLKYMHYENLTLMMPESEMISFENPMLSETEVWRYLFDLEGYNVLTVKPRDYGGVMADLSYDKILFSRTIETNTRKSCEISRPIKGCWDESYPYEEKKGNFLYFDEASDRGSWLSPYYLSLYDNAPFAPPLVGSCGEVPQDKCYGKQFPECPTPKMASCHEYVINGRWGWCPSLTSFPTIEAPNNRYFDASLADYCSYETLGERTMTNDVSPKGVDVEYDDEISLVWKKPGEIGETESNFSARFVAFMGDVNLENVELTLSGYSIQYSPDEGVTAFDLASLPATWGQDSLSIAVVLPDGNYNFRVAAQMTCESEFPCSGSSFTGPYSDWTDSFLFGDCMGVHQVPITNYCHGSMYRPDGELLPGYELCSGVQVWRHRVFDSLSSYVPAVVPLFVFFGETSRVSHLDETQRIHMIEFGFEVSEIDHLQNKPKQIRMHLKFGSNGERIARMAATRIVLIAPSGDVAYDSFRTTDSNIWDWVDRDNMTTSLSWPTNEIVGSLKPDASDISFDGVWTLKIMNPLDGLEDRPDTFARIGFDTNSRPYGSKFHFLIEGGAGSPGWPGWHVPTGALETLNDPLFSQEEVEHPDLSPPSSCVVFLPVEGGLSVRHASEMLLNIREQYTPLRFGTSCGSYIPGQNFELMLYGQEDTNSVRYLHQNTINSFNSQCEGQTGSIADYRIASEVAFFEFVKDDENPFVVMLQDGRKIKTARDMLTGSRPAMKLVGEVVAEPAGYNPNYSYYLSPDSIVFFDENGGSCDDSFSLVNENAGQWAGQTFCSVSATISREIFSP